MLRHRTSNKPTETSSKPYAIFAVFDLELTGLNPDSDLIIEAGIVLCDENGKIIKVYETLINPGRDTGPVDVHGIADEMVVNSPTFKEVAAEILPLMHDRVLVGLNNSLDFACLKRAYAELGIEFKPGDSLDLSPILRDDKFTDMYYKEIMAAINSQEIEHRALADALVAVAILPYALEFARLYPDRVKAYTKCQVVVVNTDSMVIDPPSLALPAPICTG